MVRAADCRSAGPWFKSGCALFGKKIVGRTSAITFSHVFWLPLLLIASVHRVLSLLVIVLMTVSAHHVLSLLLVSVSGRCTE